MPVLWDGICRFEKQHGTEELRAEVLKRCVDTEPRHGELWTSVSKAVENAHLSTEAILKKAVLLLEKEEASSGAGPVAAAAPAAPATAPATAPA